MSGFTSFRWIGIGLAVLLGVLTLHPGRTVAQSANALSITEVLVDRPTVHVLGVQMLITGDQNRNARVTVRYRPVESGVWRDGPPLLRVFPETVALVVPEQFAGSVFDLAPDTSYEIELHATDVDGPVDEIRTVTASTRPVPRDNPANPRTVNVASAAELSAALAAAMPGDVIVMANGIYVGPFSFDRSGTADNPIVLRGESAAGAIIDGQNCSCFALMSYGSYVHLEDFSIRNAAFAMRFQGLGTQNNVARRLLISDVNHGIWGAADQLDSYVCDNVIEGRLSWPWVYDPDADLHWDDRGVMVDGDGHVVCHNRITGFGDPMMNYKRQSRSIDFYGNDILDSFDGTELDYGGGNVRAFHNRWTNVGSAISLQPIYGGPAYVLRNVVMNAVYDQLKIKAGNNHEPSGMLIYHNTFVSPDLALNLQTPITAHNFSLMNNLFVGPQVTAWGRTVDWTTIVNNGEFDFNGYFPDAEFVMGKIGTVWQFWPNFASMQAAGVYETSGALLNTPIFAGGFIGPADGHVRQNPPDFTLATDSNAIDRGTQLPGINQSFGGAAPDMGALESGCATPIYGPRPLGSQHLAAAIDCGANQGPPVNGTPTVDAGADQTITLPASASMAGTASDDGLPNPPGALTFTWSKASGPGTVTFASPNALSTTASFSTNGVYVLRLAVSDGAASVFDDVTVTVNPAPVGTGLTGRYHNDPGTGAKFVTLALTRTDATVNFGWGGGSPGPGVQSNNFSVRWTGQVKAVATGNHTFSTIVNDGVRLWVNGQLLIDSWINRSSSATITASPIALTAGVSYTITMEFYDRTGNAAAKLRWAYPGRSTQIIPQSRLYP